MNEKDKNWWTPFHYACVNGSVVGRRLSRIVLTQLNFDYQEMAEYLVSRNADISVLDKLYRAPLHVAASHGSIMHALPSSSVIPLYHQVMKTLCSTWSRSGAT